MSDLHDLTSPETIAAHLDPSYRVAVPVDLARRVVLMRRDDDGALSELSTLDAKVAWIALALTGGRLRTAFSAYDVERWLGVGPEAARNALHRLADVAAVPVGDGPPHPCTRSDRLFLSVVWSRGSKRRRPAVSLTLDRLLLADFAATMPVDPRTLARLTTSLGVRLYMLARAWSSERPWTVQLSARTVETVIGPSIGDAAFSRWRQVRFDRALSDLAAAAPRELQVAVEDLVPVGRTYATGIALTVRTVAPVARGLRYVRAVLDHYPGKRPAPEHREDPFFP